MCYLYTCVAQRHHNHHMNGYCKDSEGKPEGAASKIVKKASKVTIKVTKMIAKESGVVTKMIAKVIG